MKFEYSPGLFGYGPQGTDGSDGIQGFAIYCTDYDPMIDSFVITNAITNNEVLWSTTEPGTKLPDNRTYLSGEIFIDTGGNLYEIDLIDLTKYRSLSLQLNKPIYFNSDYLYTDNDYKRYYNVYKEAIKYIIDNVHSSDTDINYASAISGVYNILPKNYARIEYSDVIDSSFNAFTVYSSGQTKVIDDEKSIAIVRNVDDNTFRIGNDSRDIKEVGLTFDIASLRKNTTPFSIDTSTSEIISNKEVNANSLFNGVFNFNPASFYATKTSSSMTIYWNLNDFVSSDTNVSGNLCVYQKIDSSLSFDTMIFHDVSTSQNITISDLVTSTVYCYYMNIVKNGWSRDSSIKEITIS